MAEISNTILDIRTSFEWKILRNDWIKLESGESLDKVFYTQTPMEDCSHRIRWRTWVFFVGDIGQSKDIIIEVHPEEQDLAVWRHNMNYIDFAASVDIADINDTKSCKFSRGPTLLEPFSNVFFLGPEAINITSYPANGMISFKLDVSLLVKKPTCLVGFYYDLDKNRLDFSSKIEAGRNLHPDVKLICDGGEIPCHKYVLSAQSEMFRAMFEHKFQESVTNQVEIHDTSYQVLTIMIDYIYTGNFPPNLEQHTASDLIYLASKYVLPHLVDYCVDVLMRSTKPEDFITTFILIDKFAKESKAREDIIKLMKSQARKVVESQDWKEFILKYPALVTEFVQELC